MHSKLLLQLNITKGAINNYYKIVSEVLFEEELHLGSTWSELSGSYWYCCISDSNM